MALVHFLSVHTFSGFFLYLNTKGKLTESYFKFRNNPFLSKVLFDVCLVSVVFTSENLHLRVTILVAFCTICTKFRPIAC